MCCYKTPDVFVAWRAGVSWRDQELVLLGHLLGHASYETDRFVGGQCVLKQLFKVVPVLRDTRIVTGGDVEERLSACVDVEDIRQPSVELQQSERAGKPPVRACREGHYPQRYQVIPLCLVGDVAELIRHDGRILRYSDMPADHGLIHDVVPPRLRRSLHKLALTLQPKLHNRLYPGCG